MDATTENRALVVDDERPIVDLLQDLLQDQGYEVRRAYDGMTALQLIERDMLNADLFRAIQPLRVHLPRIAREI